MESLVEFEYLGADQSVAVARLVREKPLNSLLLDTIDQLSEKIYAWLEDDKIHCIVLDTSSERAFCAGADITALYHSIKASDGQDYPYAEAFFLNEYKLDYALQTTSKPIIAWGNGIVMGGGLGLLGGCSHRIGTPSTKIAMPEITIGLFPDAGGTKFLSDLPDHLGLFAGLTGCQFASGDALALGLLDIVVELQDKEAIFSRLSTQQWSNDQTSNRAMITELLTPFAVTGDLPSNLLHHKETVTTFLLSCVGSEVTSAEDFFPVFESGLSTLPDDDWLDAAVSNYQKGSATTARIFYEQMVRAKGMSLEDMFRMELVIACQCIRHPDFPEGVRALLVDKDRNPQWAYESVSDVPDEYVQAHFQPAWSGVHPLAGLGNH